MVPHIVFHEADEGYFPGPDVWGTDRPTPTSGITQPPVLGFVLQRLHAEARDKDLARPMALSARAEGRRLAPLVLRQPRPAGDRAGRDPASLGVRPRQLHRLGRAVEARADRGRPALPPPRHPARRRGPAPDHRRNTTATSGWSAISASLSWDNGKLHDASPFQVVDPGFNAILIRSDEALAELAEELGLTEIAAAARARVAKARAAFPLLWNDKAGQFVCFDRVAGSTSRQPVRRRPAAAFAGLGDADRMIATIRRWRSRMQFGVASHDPADPRFEPRRYWRGPCWLVVNYMLADGLAAADGRMPPRRSRPIVSA